MSPRKKGTAPAAQEKGLTRIAYTVVEFVDPNRQFQGKPAGVVVRLANNAAGKEIADAAVKLGQLVAVKARR